MRSLFLSVVLVLLMCGTTLAATRQEIQIALDVIRFTNVANDLFDSTSEFARSNKIINEGILGDSEPRVLTDEEVKEMIQNRMDSVQAYNNKVLEFLDISENFTKATTGLAVLDVTVDSIIVDNQNMKVHAIKIKDDAKQASNKKDITNIADYIDANISPLPLVRKK